MKQFACILFFVVFYVNSSVQAFKNEKLVVLNYSITVDEVFVKATEKEEKKNLKLKDFSLKNTPMYETYTDYDGKETRFRHGPELGDFITASLIDTLFEITKKTFKTTFNSDFYPLSELGSKLNLIGK